MKINKHDNSKSKASNEVHESSHVVADVSRGEWVWHAIAAEHTCNLAVCMDIMCIICLLVMCVCKSLRSGRRGPGNSLHALNDMKKTCINAHVCKVSYNCYWKVKLLFLLFIDMHRGARPAGIRVGLRIITLPRSPTQEVPSDMVS